jgi:hypothetical protein
VHPIAARYSCICQPAFFISFPCLQPAAHRTPLSPAAFAIKQRIYGNRIVLFAPLYIANHCVNNCRYCAFRQGNKSIEARRAGLGWLGWEGRQGNCPVWCLLLPAGSLRDAT